MVAGIEKEIGGNLFDRSTNPVSLTPLGAKYLECAGSISMIEDDFFNYMNELQGLETGSIALGSNTLYMSNIIPDILSVYYDKRRYRLKGNELRRDQMDPYNSRAVRIPCCMKDAFPVLEFI